MVNAGAEILNCSRTGSAAAVKLAFGEMGRDTLLASARVWPKRLLADGFEFRFPQLESALRHTLFPNPHPA
jgi:NAD dependent epimerase/dehydratase family enzyme